VNLGVASGDGLVGWRSDIAGWVLEGLGVGRQVEGVVADGGVVEVLLNRTVVPEYSIQTSVAFLKDDRSKVPDWPLGQESAPIPLIMILVTVVAKHTE
jgi:hypothetical protein